MISSLIDLTCISLLNLPSLQEWGTVRSSLKFSEASIILQTLYEENNALTLMCMMSFLAQNTWNNWRLSS